MIKRVDKPLLHKRIFWDGNFHDLDYDRKPHFIIERVINRGDVEDIRQCRRYYGEEKVRSVLLNAKFIANHRLHLASAIINQPLSAFKCYTLKQLNPTLFPY